MGDAMERNKVYSKQSYKPREDITYLNRAPAEFISLIQTMMDGVPKDPDYPFSTSLMSIETEGDGYDDNYGEIYVYLALDVRFYRYETDDELAARLAKIEKMRLAKLELKAKKAQSAEARRLEKANEASALEAEIVEYAKSMVGDPLNPVHIDKLADYQKRYKELTK